jgi:site-specific DNA recombinase
MEDMLTTEYDGCGRCLVAVRRLSRKTDKTSSPQRQGDQDLQAAADAEGHIIAWADDWEVSGATDPMTRKGLGPWLRGEMGPYDGIVAPTVDRVGRNVRDTLNTQTLLTGQARVIVTADHAGVWDFTDPNQENEWLIKAWGSQMELRAIQKRNRDETVRARENGEPKQRPSYGYIYIRPAPTAKIDHVELDPVAAEIIREVARRILADETGKVTCATEAARLTREGVPAPLDASNPCLQRVIDLPNLSGIFVCSPRSSGCNADSFAGSIGNLAPGLAPTVEVDLQLPYCQLD